MIEPDERLQPDRVVVVRDVERRAVDPEAASDRGPAHKQVGPWAALAFAGKLERRSVGAPGLVSVPVAVAIPEEVEARTRPELDEVERQASFSGDPEECGKECPGALHLVRLHRLLGDEAREPRTALAQHLAEAPPRVLLLARELEEPDAAEEAERRLPARLEVADDLRDE